MSGRGQGQGSSRGRGRGSSHGQGTPPQQPQQQGNPQQGNPQQGQQPSQQQGNPQPSQQQGQQPSQQQGQQSRQRRTSFASGTKGNSSQQSSRARSSKPVNNLRQLMNIINREGGIKDKDGKTTRETQKWVNERHEDAREILKHGVDNHILELDPQKRQEEIMLYTSDDTNSMESPAKIIDNIKDAIQENDTDKLYEIVNDYEVIMKSITKLSRENRIDINAIKF